MASVFPPPSLTRKIPEQNHDVFLSFRGLDTRYNFTSHLYAALTRHQIKTYIDNELERGNEISHSLLRAINHAKLSIIVFSENYASSRWCLEELVSILKCKKDDGQILVPIFYHVNPTNVRNQTGSYGVALAEHEKRSDMNKVQTWRIALTEAANLSGWNCLGTGNESELVEQIAKDILQKLESITSRGLEGRINTYKQIAQQKQEKSLRTGNLADMEELITTLYQLAELKLEKASSSNDWSVWSDVIGTHERILQLKLDKWMRTYSAKDLEDIKDARNHLLHFFENIPTTFAR
ncbi:disease resistance protein RPV1-like [Vicia villosa]|uniref:disease resistance protein RPV1-like n=1 Tax=Vicia villosa TaxID=3911 RepID=UPI00273B6515|nr:disease resistance protein RPV1-like [Vicia villosa]